MNQRGVSTGKRTCCYCRAHCFGFQKLQDGSQSSVLSVPWHLIPTSDCHEYLVCTWCTVVTSYSSEPNSTNLILLSPVVLVNSRSKTYHPGHSDCEWNLVYFGCIDEVSITTLTI